MKLAFPEYNIRLTRLNGEDIVEGSKLEALMLAEFEGQIERQSKGAIVEDFSGTLNVTVYDKPLTKWTRENNEDSPRMEYEVLESIIFQGQATVENGKFRFSFIVPKDIDYSPGSGKVLMYAESSDASMDASRD